jgi:chromosome segregation ATPase
MADAEPLGRRLEERLEVLDDTLASRLAGYEELETRLSFRLAELERSDQRLASRLDEAARFEGAFDERLERFERILASLQETAESTVPTATAQLVATMRAEGSEVDEAFAARLEALEEVTGELARHGTAITELQAALSGRVDEVGRAAATVTDGAAGLSELDERLRERTDALGETAAGLAQVAERAATIQQLETVLEERASAFEQAGSVLTERLGRLQQATAALEQVGSTELAGRLEHLDRALSTMGEVVAQLESGSEAVAATVAQQRDAQERQREELATAIRGAEARLVSAVQDEVAGFVTEATEAANAARGASERLAAALRDLEAVEHVLAEHRTSLAGTLGHERQALLDDVLDRVIEELPARARRRLAERLVEHGAGRPQPTRTGAPAAATPPPVPHTAPPAGTAPAGDDASVDGDDGEVGAGDAVEEEAAPAPETGPPPRPRGASVPVRPRLAELLGDEDDDLEDFDIGPPLLEEELARARQERAAAARAELAERAVEVRGIGPARAELLAEMFGDLDTLLSATPEEISTRTGLPPALAGDVLDHLRG